MKKTSIDIVNGFPKLVAERLGFTEEFDKLTDASVPFGREVQDIVFQYLSKEKPQNTEEWAIYWLDDNYDEIIKKYGSLQNYYDKTFSQSCVLILRKIIQELVKGKYTFVHNEQESDEDNPLLHLG